MLKTPTSHPAYHPAFIEPTSYYVDKSVINNAETKFA